MLGHMIFVYILAYMLSPTLTPPSSPSLGVGQELENVKKKLKKIEEETGNLRQRSALIEKEIGGSAEGEYLL